MQTDMWYELTLLTLSGDDGVSERLKEAASAQPAPPDDESERDDPLTPTR